MRHKTILQPGEHRGFKKAISAIPLGKIPMLRKELQNAIGGTPSKAFYYQSGATIIRKPMTKKLTKIFTGYGLKPDEIFDE